MNAIVAFFLLVETKESDDDNGDFREILVWNVPVRVISADGRLVIS